MYDCHIGMRRLCDWDLWLRYIRHVPFVVADEVVSEVFEANPGSIGLTVPWDLPLFRYLHDIPRDELLTPTRWREYAVDALRIAEVEVEKDLRRRLYEEHIVPYYLRYRHRFPQLEGFPATLPVRRTVLYTKNSYDVSNDVTLNHYDRPCSVRGTYKAHYQPLGQVEPTWPRDADALLLVRTVEDAAAGALDVALAQNVPVGFYLDDAGSGKWVMRNPTFGDIASITGNPRLYAQTPGGAFAHEILGYPVFLSTAAAAIAASAKSVYFGNWFSVGFREEPALRLIRDPYSVDGLVILKYSFRTVYGVLTAGGIWYGVHPSA